MPDEAVADTGVSAAPPADAGAAAPAVTPDAGVPQEQQQTTEQPDQQAFDPSIFDGQEEDIPQEGQQPQQLANLLQISPYIQDEQTLQNAIQRQHSVEAVLAGQEPASSLFEGMRQQNPQQWTQLMNGVAQYIEQVSGLKLTDPSQVQQQMTPEQQRIAALERQQQDYVQQQQSQRQQQQVQQAQKQLIDALPELTKGRFVEGDDPQWLLSQLGSRLAGKEAQVVAAIQRGDLTMVKQAIAQVAHEERIRFNARGKRVAQQRIAVKNAVPKGIGSKGSPETIGKDFDLTTPEGRSAYYKQAFTN